MYLLNNKLSYLKRWRSGVRFAVEHKQSRVRNQLPSSIFFFIFIIFFFHYYYYFVTFLLNLIMFDCSNRKPLNLRRVAPVHTDNFWIMRNLQKEFGHTGGMAWIELGCIYTREMTLKARANGEV